MKPNDLKPLRAAPDRSPPQVLSEGQARLLALPQSNGEIARALCVENSAVSQWKRGKTRPNLQTARQIEALYNVPLRDWQVLPRSVSK